MYTTDKNWENLGITNDFLFGKIMQDSKLCKELLQRILPDLNIDHIEYPELQKSIHPDIAAKGIRLDVYVKDEKDIVYNIEMQACNKKELPKRSRYYQSMVDLQLLDSGEKSYQGLNKSYIIFICTFDLYLKGRYVYTFENICREDKNIAMGDEAIKIFLNANGKIDDINKKLKVFLDYVAGKKSNDFFIEELETAIKKAKKNRKWRHEYMTLKMRDLLNLEQGREEGREEGIRGMVSALKDLGIPPQTILIQLQEKFNLSLENSQKYLQ